jgi:Zn-dependent protease with chaperone function
MIAPMEGRGTTERIYRSLAHRMDRRRLEALVRAGSLRPRFTIGWVAALALALMVHSLTILLLVLALYSVANGGVAGLLIGGFLLLLLWVLRPRISRIDEPVLPRSEFPVLYGLVDRVADSIGAPRIAIIGVSVDFNAATTRDGLLARRALVVGAPFLCVLSHQERVALLGHEIGHQANGDFGRNWVIGAAATSLSAWHEVLMPDSLFGDGDISGILSFPFQALLAGLAMVAYGGRWLLAVLLYQTGQRAEYFADHLAARAAGTPAAVGMLEKLALGRDFAIALEALAINPGRDMLAEVRGWSTTSAAELRQALKRYGDEARLDSTHPPTMSRIEMLERRPTEVGMMTHTAAESASLDAELAKLERSIRTRITDLAGTPFHG